MKRTFTLILMAAAASVVVGCQSSSTSAEKTPESKSQESHPGHSKDAEKIRAALAKLSPEDRALAEAQRLCPVSDEPLGSMDVPIKLTLKGQTVFICCKACKTDAEKDPDGMFKKVAEFKARNAAK